MGDEIVVRRLSGTHPRQGRNRLITDWLDRRWLDWVAALLLGALLRFAILPLVHLHRIDPGIRFSVYGAVAAGIFAFVAIAFTPLAILTAFGPGENIDRLRGFGIEIRRSFLGGTLVLLLCALVLIGCGAADATTNASTLAEAIASVALGLAVMKILRLTELFSAILGANRKDTAKRNQHRRARSVS